jgi:hypothetical protein
MKGGNELGKMGNKEERSKYDYYVTPQEDVRAFIEAFTEDHGDVFTGRLILDPCAGGDEDHEMTYPVVIEDMFNQDTVTMDIREDSKADLKEDFLDYDFGDLRPDVVITNPPFNRAMEFIEKSIGCSDKYVIMLLRLSFLESKKRYDFFQDNMPTHIYVHHKRISFTDDGKTDSAAYAHFVWQIGNNPKFAKTKII